MKTTVCQKPITCQKWTKAVLLFFTLLAAAPGYSYDTTAYSKRWTGFSWGFTLEQGWGSIVNDNSGRDFFYKPNIGGAVHAGYYFNPFIGVETGFYAMQRGAGIKTPDFVKGVGEPDSTYRLRLRIFTCYIPISVNFRTPFFHPNLKLSGSVGYNQVFSTQARETFNSVEDGFHVITDVQSQYKKGWGETGFSLGFDFNANEASIFRVQYYYWRGLGSVYSSSSSYKGTIVTQGLKMQWIF